jgi:hypothetical protein
MIDNGRPHTTLPITTVVREEINQKRKSYMHVMSCKICIDKLS